MSCNSLRTNYARLRAAGHKLTEPRRRIIEKLHLQKRAFTAPELHEQVARQGVSLATVYRTMELLVELGLVEMASHTGDERLYIACSPVDHHHHVVCKGCGRVADITECLLEPFEELVREQTNFTIEGHTVEFHGYCATCQP